MTLKIGFLMDPISTIKPYKDTSFAMALEAQARGHELYYFEQKDLSIDQGQAKVVCQRLSVFDDSDDYYQLASPQSENINFLDVILMRKDPPVDDQFTFTTHILSLAEQQGVLVVNRPQALRDFNEKLFTSYFPTLIPPTLVTRNRQLVDDFHSQHGDIICKPLDGMGGASIFRIKQDGTNLGVVFETLTDHGQRLAMFQQFQPAIKDGDKRILIVHGEVIPYCLARLPTGNETRGNIAAGGTGRPQAISDSDRHIAEQVAPTLMANGIWFCGLDVIGDRITEINVTSPTCVREIEAAFDINICGQLFTAIEAACPACI